MNASRDTQVLLISAMGIRYLAAWLDAHGVVSEVIPAHLNSGDEISRRLTSRPGLALVGFSLHTSSLQTSLESMAFARAVRHDTPIAVGGYLPTFGAAALRRCGARFDFLLGGESESSLLDLVHSLLGGGDPEGIPGVTRFADIPEERLGVEAGRGRQIALDDLVTPLRTRSDMPDGIREVMVSASRGCYGHCSFCSVPAFGRHGWRGRSPDHVADEVALLARDFGAEFIDYVDDSLLGPTDGADRAVQLRDAMAAHRVRLPFRASLRVNDIDLDRIRPLKECGLAAVQLGVESFSNRQLQDVYRKDHRPLDALRALRLLEEERIHVQIGLILFEPSTALADLEENARVLANERWGVAKSNACMLFCAEGTQAAANLVARGASLGLDSGLNHAWDFTSREAAVVHRALLAHEEANGGLGEQLVDAVTPPHDPVGPRDVRNTRLLQNAYQRLSFRALAIACRAAGQATSDDIAASLERQLGAEYRAIRTEAEATLPPAMQAS